MRSARSGLLMKGRPMATVAHNVVGLQHASMAIFNAFCDRAPILVLGGTGPMDTSKRRPWIDWIHTSSDQASIVRDIIKFEGPALAWKKALQSAKLDLLDLSFVESHDCFTSAELIEYEAMGLTAPGEGERAILEGDERLVGQVRPARTDFVEEDAPACGRFDWYSE